MAIRKKGKGRILSIRFGYNPNSSSLGAAVQILTWGAALSAVAVISVAAGVRLFRRWRNTTNVKQL